MAPQDTHARKCPTCGLDDQVNCKLHSVTELPSGLKEGNVECYCARCKEKFYHQPIGDDPR